MLLCTPDDIADLILADYLAACEGKNPGITGRTIAAVSGEIRDALTARYPQPWPTVPDLLRNIAATFAAYRIVGSLTSLVDTESSTENPWLPLQKQWKYCSDILADIIAGKRKLPLVEVSPDDREDAAISVISSPAVFDWRGF